MPKLKVCELFAGVGGFRLGLENTGHYEIVWSNQWEPSTKSQHASWVYEARFGRKNHSNQNIEEVPTSQIPDHDVLVGGFPCQDYSVATSLKNSKGLLGKKGVLWWSIHRIINEKENKPKVLLLENVDRLLKSPATQRGRDFAVMLKSLCDLGYAVEWRVINAAEYGMPQRRKRVFFFAYYKSTPLYEALKNSNLKDWVFDSGTMAMAFPVLPKPLAENNFELSGDLVELSQSFSGGKISPFFNSGICVNNHVRSFKVSTDFKGKHTLLSEILQDSEIPNEYYINSKDLPKWQYLKGAKKEIRTSKAGHTYHYGEGAMAFPDVLDKPARTIITGEGGATPSRFKHVVQTKKGLRRLTPIELERLNMFPDNHTELEGVSDTKRAFFMGNALVVGIIEQLAKVLFTRIG
ncbi:MAG: DNA (cytosine-5-)-methyltransferase [Allomuricauda sp.]|nr:MAG: DNA (cytosine-5-)-methyltransferase [Allomuricauda sp.]